MPVEDAARALRDEPLGGARPAHHVDQIDRVAYLGDARAADPDRSFARLVALLDSPTTCPHGNPIPGFGAPGSETLVTIPEREREHRREASGEERSGAIDAPQPAPRPSRARSAARPSRCRTRCTGRAGATRSRTTGPRWASRGLV